MAVLVQLVLIAHLPCPAGRAIVVALRLLWRLESSLLCIESVAVFILCAANFAWTACGIDLEDGIIRAIDIRIDSETEKMLVVVRVDTWVDFSAPAVSVLAWAHGVGVQNTGEFDLELNGAVLVEDPVYAVFVVGSGEDV